MTETVMSIVTREKIIEKPLYEAAIHCAQKMMDFAYKPGISKQCVPYKEQNKSLLITVLNCSGYIKAIQNLIINHKKDRCTLLLHTATDLWITNEQQAMDEILKLLNKDQEYHV